MVKYIGKYHFFIKKVTLIYVENTIKMDKMYCTFSLG